MLDLTTSANVANGDSAEAREWLISAEKYVERLDPLSGKDGLPWQEPDR